jgi:hypothetical protein
VIKYKTSILLLVIFVSAASYVSHADDFQVKNDERTSIFADEVKKGTSEDFINLMKEYRIVDILGRQGGDTPYIYNWPKKSDISHLLSIINNKDTCGVLGNPWSAYLIPRAETLRSCDFVALDLLGAIKEGRFRHLPPPVTSNYTLKEEITEQEKQQLLKWAQEEVSK